VAEWIDLFDPTEDELRAKAPKSLHPAALRLLVTPHERAFDTRPRIETHGDYVFGVLLVAVAVPAEDRVFYQEIDFVLTEEALLTVSKTPPGEHAFDPKDAKQACEPSEHPAMYLYRLVDGVAERYLDLLDDLIGEIDEVEDLVEAGLAQDVRRRLTELRRDFLHLRKTLGPTRDAIRAIVDGRLSSEGVDLFPREVELHFADAYDKLLRASEGLDLSRDLVAGVRDYVQAKLASDQNDVVKRLTIIAAIFLPPTFIVGVYGQNFDHMPELHWRFGYPLVLGLIGTACYAIHRTLKRNGWL